MLLFAISKLTYFLLSLRSFLDTRVRLTVGITNFAYFTTINIITTTSSNKILIVIIIIHFFVFTIAIKVAAITNFFHLVVMDKYYHKQKPKLY